MFRKSSHIQHVLPNHMPHATRPAMSHEFSTLPATDSSIPKSAEVAVGPTLFQRGMASDSHLESIITRRHGAPFPSRVPNPDGREREFRRQRTA